MTLRQVVARLRALQGTRTQYEFAKELGCSVPMLSLVYRGLRQPGPKLLAPLGLERHINRTTTYRRTRSRT